MCGWFRGGCYGEHAFTNCWLDREHTLRGHIQKNRVSSDAGGAMLWRSDYGGVSGFWCELSCEAFERIKFLLSDFGNIGGDASVYLFLAAMADIWKQ